MRISDWSSDVCSSDLIDFFRNGDIYVPEVPPDPRFDQPGSGLYAVIVLPEGQQSWRSMSTRGPQLPEEEMLAPNQEEFRGPLPISSEEHTSELQSLMRISYAVFCLKKKKKLQNATYIHTPHNTMT